jgi:hypothetical protein
MVIQSGVESDFCIFFIFFIIFFETIKQIQLQ